MCQLIYLIFNSFQNAKSVYVRQQDDSLLFSVGVYMGLFIDLIMSWILKFFWM